MQRTSLYRHFDAHGRLLYVGISLNAVSRLADHKQSHWFADIFRVQIEHHKSRPHALYAEALAILAEKPLHNLVKPIPIDPDLVPDEEPPMETAVPTVIPSVPLSRPSGPRSIVYTIIPKEAGPKKKVERSARKRLERIAGLVPEGVGYVSADVEGERDGFIRVIQIAQFPGMHIITDRPEVFAKATALLARRQVTLVPMDFS